MATYDDFFSSFGDGGKGQQAIQTAGSLYNMYNGIKTANDTNNQVQGMTGQNQATISNALNGLQGQQAGNLAANNATVQNQLGLLQSLTDPNSAYMQQARQAIERKDAAAGRNSQWGDREVQLAALLAQNAAQYSPGIANSITGVTGQQNQSLAQLLQAQQAAAQQANTTGRQASNATGNTVQSGINALAGLSKLFGSGNDLGTAKGSLTQSSTGYGSGLSGLGGQQSVEQGITGQANNDQYDYNYGGAGPETTFNYGVGSGNLFDNNNYTGSSLNYTPTVDSGYGYNFGSPDYGDLFSDDIWSE